MITVENVCQQGITRFSICKIVPIVQLSKIHALSYEKVAINRAAS